MITTKHILSAADCEEIINLPVIHNLKRNYLTNLDGSSVSSKDNLNQVSWCCLNNVFDKFKDKLQIDDNCEVELLLYPTGSSNNMHRDHHGPLFTFKEGKMVKPAQFFIWKTTTTILLNDNFEGGVLSFLDFNATFDKTFIGTSITFPAGDNGYPHEVTKVTSGNRYSLVIRRK